MLRELSTTTPTTDVQVGCWPRFIPWRRLGKPQSKGDQTGSISSLSADIPGYLINKQGGAELPPYVHFSSGWYGCYDEEAARYASDFADKPPQYEDVGIPSNVLDTIEETIKELSPELRQLSLDIWNHPEVMYEESTLLSSGSCGQLMRTYLGRVHTDKPYAHNRLTAFMTSYGFTVTPHYLGLDTAWRATFTHTQSDAYKNKKQTRNHIRVIGINSEMDALPRIGHACGHNLIAMSGVAVALAIKAALKKHDVSGTVVLLGTPAEEAGGGKITLLERGAYENMDACIMSHPSSGPENFSALWSGMACQHLDVEFFGHSSHASSAPWEAQNALDAAFVAYASISALRQQIKPDHRVQGIVVGRDWVPNIIPDYAKMRYIVRAPTWAEAEALRERVRACFDAAALATGCKIEVTLDAGYYEVRNNDVLGLEYAKVIGERYGIKTARGNGVGYSTDFGNVSFALPALHPVYSIPTEPNGSNHTPQFAKSAATPEAHAATLKVAAGLAATGFRVLQDADFANRVKKFYEEQTPSGSV